MMYLLHQFLGMRRRFSADESAATAIEYGLLAAGISVVIIGTVFLIGPALEAAFNSALNALEHPPGTG